MTSPQEVGPAAAGRPVAGRARRGHGRPTPSGGSRAVQGAGLPGRGHVGRPADGGPAPEGRRGRAGRRRDRPLLADARHPARARRRRPALDARAARPPGARRRWPRRRRPAGLTEADAERAREIVVAALAGGRRMRRADLLAAIDGRRRRDHRPARLPPALVPGADRHAVPRPHRRRRRAAVRAARRLGAAPRGGWPATRRSASWPAASSCGHGPATVQDLARWAGHPARATRAPGWPSSGRSSAALDVDGVEHFLDPETPDRLAACRDGGARRCSCCPASTSSCSATATGSAVLDPEFADRIVPGQQRHVPADRRPRRPDRRHLAVDRPRREADGDRDARSPPFPDEAVDGASSTAPRRLP